MSIAVMLMFSQNQSKQTKTSVSAFLRRGCYSVLMLMNVAQLAGCSGGSSGGSSSPSQTATETFADTWTGYQQIGIASKESITNAVLSHSGGGTFVGGYVEAAYGDNTMQGAQDAFLAKYDSAGTLLWHKQYGGASGYAEILGLAEDSAKAIYSVGYTTRAMNGETRSGSGTHAFIMKHDTSGNLIWTKLLGGTTGSTIATAVGIDSDDNIYIGGYTSSSLGSNTLVGASEPMIAKYDSDGNMVWVKQLSEPATKSGSIYGLKVSGSLLYVVGDTAGALPGKTMTGTSDGFVTKLNLAGTVAWYSQFGVSSTTTGFNAVDVDSTGSVYVVGHSEGALNGETFVGTSNPAIVKVSASTGSAVWTRLINATGMSATISSIRIDSEDRINCVGDTNRAIGSETQQGSRDAFAMQYDTSGTRTWVKHLGSGFYTKAKAVDVDPALNLVITGITTGAMGTATQTGAADIFVTKLTSAGVQK